MSRLERLFQPIDIGGLHLPNRLVMLAISTRYDFEESNRLEDFYAERARGGVGLIVIGALQTLFPGRKAGGNRLGVYSDSSIPRLSKLVERIHNGGARAAAQLATYGYWSPGGLEGTAEHVGPSAVTLPREGVHPNIALAEFEESTRALTVAEIGTVKEAVVAAAIRAQRSGFDAVELQCVGGNLLHRFTNPFTNTRTDQYGGSIENRTRILTEIISRIKNALGEAYPIICRIPGMDMVPWGLGVDEWGKIALILQKAGADALSIYPGWHESREPRVQMCVPRNAFVWVASAIKQEVTIPVIAGIRINDPVAAEQMLAEGKADMIGMGRPLIADPDLPRKARSGKLEDILMCTACCVCYDAAISGKPLLCSVNPRAGRESEYVIAAAGERRRVVVVGGGPAGMEAAIVAALRGHQVTLLEKCSDLGGQLRCATMPPYKQEWKTTISYLANQLRKLGVTVKLNTECHAENVLEAAPDAVIVATGALPRIPDIPGIKGSNVCTAIDVLTGKSITGKRVVVAGGGSVGCETAEYLAAMGKQVTVLELLGRTGPDYGPVNRWVVIDRLIAAGIRLETNSKVTKITGRGVQIVRSDLYPEFFEADSVVLAMGMVPAAAIMADLAGKVPVLYTAGDVVKPATVCAAMQSGLRAGLIV